MIASWYRAAVEQQPLLWILGILFYGIGDTVTTAIGLQNSGAEEAGPVAVHLIEMFGIGGLIVMKLGLFASFFGFWYLLRTPGRAAIPLALTIMGIAVTAWNSAVLLS